MTSVGVYETADAFNPVFVAASLENGKCLDSIPRIKEGFAVTESGRALKVQTEGPHLVSLGSGRLSTAITIHPLPQGRIYIGGQNFSQCKGFVLHGIGIEKDHCFIENNNGIVTIYPQSGSVFIDGNQILEPTRLSQGCMLCFGRSCFFRFNNPKEARLMKENLPNNMSHFGSTTSLPEIKTNYHQIIRRPSAGSFDMESVDFVEKVSKFEYLSHSQLPPQTSQDTPKWFVKEGVRIPKTPTKQRGPKSQSPLDCGNLRNPSPLSRFMDSTTPVTKHGFSTPPPNQSSSPNKVTVSPKLTRFYSKTPDPIGVSRKSPGNLSASSSTKSGTLSGCSSHHVSAENIRACEKELKEQHRKAVQERLKDEEQERQERLRLEEILNLCAEYEERSQREKQCKEAEENPPSVSSSSASSREFSGVSSGTSNPESTNSSKGSHDSYSMRTESNMGCFQEEVRFNGNHELQAFPKAEPPSNILLSNSIKLNASPPFTHAGGYHTVPNRIKTNGSLPRDRSASHFSPSNEMQAFSQAQTIDYNSGTGSTLYVNHKVLNSASSEDELCAILGNTTIVKSSPSAENQAVDSSSVNCPHSPRTRIRTVAGLQEKGPEIYENRLALSEYSRSKQGAPYLSGQDSFTVGQFEVERIPLRNIMNGNTSNLDGELEGEIYQLQRERQHCIQTIGAIKQKVSELDVQKTEFLNEHGMEHALLAGELKDEEERQAMESGRISDLQNRKIALEQKCAITQEEIEIAREKVNQQEKKVQDMRDDLKLLQDQCSSHLTDDIEIKLEKLKSQMEFLDLEKRAFEDLEFQQLESQAHREEEKEALSQEIDRLTNNLTLRQKKLNELALQKLKLVTQLEKEKYNFECQLKTYTDHLQQEVAKLEDVSNKLKTLTSLNPGMIPCFSDDSSPRTSDSDLEVQRNGSWDQHQGLNHEGNGSPNQQRYSGERSDNCNSFHSFESESSSLTSSDTGGENGRRHEDQIKPMDSEVPDPNKMGPEPTGSEEAEAAAGGPRGSLGGPHWQRPMLWEVWCREGVMGPVKVKQREQALQSALQDQRPLVSQHENGSFEVKRREKHKAQRPLTRYLPVRNTEFDLRHHIESAGHQIELCPHIHLTSSSCHGAIHKLGGKWKTWKKRWFVFDRIQKVLLYYSDKSESKLKGGIYFQSIAEVYVDHLHSVKSPNPHSTFCVKTYDKIYYLMAPTPEAMRVWVDVIFTGAEGYLDFITEGE